MMQAAVLYGANDLRLEERPVPIVKPGSILLRVKACAMCGSDLRILRDGSPRITKPRIIGHEVSGEIVEVGAGVKGYSIGDRVSIGADVPCGNCDHCLSGRANCCDTNYAIGYQFDGGYADYILLDPLVVKYGPLSKFNQKLSWSEAALAEPLACCLNGYERALYLENSGGTVVIFGAGPIGLMLLILGKKLYGAEKVVMIEPSQVRRTLAVSLGADCVMDPSAEDVVANVKRLTQGQGAQAIFTACPAVETHTQAIEMVAKRGVVNLFGGLPKSEPPITLMSNFLHYREAYVTGSHGSTPQQHAKALDLIETRTVNVKPLITETIALDSIHKGITLASSGTTAKIVICPVNL